MGFVVVKSLVKSIRLMVVFMRVEFIFMVECLMVVIVHPDKKMMILFLINFKIIYLLVTLRKVYFIYVTFLLI